MHDTIAAVIRDRDTLGGVLEVAALYVPPGLGSYTQVDRRLDARLAERLADYKVPKFVEFMEGLPRNPAGKVSKPELRYVPDKVTE